MQQLNRANYAINKNFSSSYRSIVDVKIDSCLNNGFIAFQIYFENFLMHMIKFDWFFFFKTERER